MDVNILPEKAPETSSSETPSSLENNKADRSFSGDDPTDLDDKAAERKLLLKLDIYVLPVLALLFLVSFVDRSNVANARIQGLEKSLHIPPKSNGYNIALFSFTIPYVLFEVPANIALKRVKPQWWLSGLMFSWGKTSGLYLETMMLTIGSRCLYNVPRVHTESRRTRGVPRDDGIL